MYNYNYLLLDGGVSESGEATVSTAFETDVMLNEGDKVKIKGEVFVIETRVFHISQNVFEITLRRLEPKRRKTF